MKTKAIYLTAFLLGVACTVIYLAVAAHYHGAPARPLLTNNTPRQPTNELQRKPTPPVVQPITPEPLPATASAAVVQPSTPQPPKSDGQPGVKRPAIAPANPPATNDPRLNDPVVKEELGRYALNYVGNDPVADKVWATLIYDDSLPDKTREDLMEDLNENGFSAGNGKVATADDLPLIASRIVLLEDHMRDADDFMLPHLAEAHKDLVNMWFALRQ